MKNENLCAITLFWGDNAPEPVKLFLPETVWLAVDRAAEQEHQAREGRLRSLGRVVTAILDRAEVDYHEKYYPQDGPDEARLNITFSDLAGTSYFVTIYNEVAARCTACPSGYRPGHAPSPVASAGGDKGDGGEGRCHADTAHRGDNADNVVSLRPPLHTRSLEARRFGTLGAMLDRLGQNLSLSR